jgi:hypothetical protein
MILPSRHVSRIWPRIIGPRHQFSLGGVGCKCCGGGSPTIPCSVAGSRCAIPTEDLTLTYTFFQDAPDPFPPIVLNLVFNASGPFISTTGTGPVWLSQCYDLPEPGDLKFQLECTALGARFCSHHFTSTDESCVGTDSPGCSSGPVVEDCDISAYTLTIQCSPFMLTWTLNQTTCPPDRTAIVTMVITA